MIKIFRGHIPQEFALDSLLGLIALSGGGLQVCIQMPLSPWSWANREAGDRGREAIAIEGQTRQPFPSMLPEDDCTCWGDPTADLQTADLHAAASTLSWP